MTSTVKAAFGKPLVIGALVTGLAFGSYGLASAASGSNSTTTAATTTQAAPAASQTAPPGNPATLSHGPDETLASADIAAKAKTAVERTLPGSTIIRVETDSSGHAYEAHVQKSDGSYATVYFDSSMNVTGTVSGFGGHP